MEEIIKITKEYREVKKIKIIYMKYKIQNHNRGEEKIYGSRGRTYL